MARPPLLLNLTTHQLQYLVTMERAASLTDAADELGISPSALSQGLTELERRIGVALFERRGRARVLTARGRELVAHGERVLAATRDLTRWAADAAEGRRGSVRLGLIDIAAVSHFPDTLIRFRSDRPDVELHLSVAPSAALIEQLADGRLDAAVVVEPAETDPTASADAYRALASTELLTEDLAVYRPSLAPPPDRAAGPGRAVERWGPWVTFPATSHTRRHIAAALRRLGVEFRVEAESHQPEVLRQMVNLGMGWTVLPVLQAEAEPNPLVRARPEPLLTRRLVLAERSSSPSDPATAELVERLRVDAAARP